ncbi:TetR/AcrR family transcriptional regulator [Streptomyces sp. RB6PN25]|uniref:TetR/AcrR family transcriptional regulator n=1 Tax=Streptomyces humicola TaxID=2953240 RepID=A0ABT1PPE3_9ACTN|nr:TetR/AcrR family transcriptional regulator [Streptomyces humicola]MCQ4079546.1 TetR/AcrR family transcriptional regulator [Streptomyces humicola]
MTSNRHNSRGATTSDNDAVLDAVRDCVLAVGVRRTTLTDVARRAGVSRMTLYRRWPDLRTLVGDLMTREWVAVGVGVMPEAWPDGGSDGTGARPARELLVDGLVEGVRTLRDHPLFRKIVDVDPELLLPYVLDRRGASQNALLELIIDALRRGHADGSVRRDHAVRQARTLLLVVQSFVLSLRTMTDDAPDADPALTTEAFDDELRHLLERTLAP